MTRKIFGSQSRSWSLILKASVSEGVVSVSNGQVLVLDDEVSDDEAETLSLVGDAEDEQKV